MEPSALVEGAADPRPARRHVVLRLATGFANFHLVLFAVDAVLSVLDLAVRDPDLTALRVQHPALHALRVGLALALLATSIVMPLVLLFVPHLPKAPYLPSSALVVGIVLASMLDGPRVKAVTGWLTLLQVLVAVGSFALVKRRTGAWFQPAAALPRKRHLVARTIVATVVIAVTMPLFGAAAVALGFFAVLESETGGYVDVTLSGIHVRETVLAKDDRTVVLQATMHYGDEAFYKTLFDERPSGALVLAEGVTDRRHRLAAFPAPKFARALGLSAQPEAKPTPLRGAPRAADDRGAVEGAAGPDTPDQHEGPDVILADGDMADFSETTIEMLREIALINDGDTVPEVVRRLVAHLRSNTREKLVIVRRELIDARNAKVLVAVDEHAGRYPTILIPWGAMHMPGIEAGLRQRGYAVRSQRNRPVVRFGAISGVAADVPHAPS